MATYSNNTTIKVQGTIGAGSVVPANSYAIASYAFVGRGFDPNVNPDYNSFSGGGFQVYYGPGSTISGSVLVGQYTIPGPAYTNIYASLVTNPVLFQNTP